MQDRVRHVSQLQYLLQIPWSWLLLFLPIVLLVGSLLLVSDYRVQSQSRQLYPDSNKAYTAVVYDPQYGAFCLSVTAPLQLYVDDSSPRNTPIEIEVFPIQQSQLLTNTAVSVTPIYTPSVSTLRIGSTCTTNTAVSVTPIYTPTKITCTHTESTDIELTGNTITNTGTISYIVTLTGSSSGGSTASTPNLSELNDAIQHEFMIEPGLVLEPPRIPIPQTFHDRRRWPPAYALTVGVRQENAQDTLGSIDLSIPVQGYWDAIFTQSWSVVSDHIVAIWIGFIPIYFSFMAVYWRFYSNKWQRSREEEISRRTEEILKRIQSLYTLRYQDPLKFVKELDEIESLLANARQQSGHSLRTPEVDHALQKARQELIEPKFEMFLKLLSPEGEIIIEAAALRNTLEWVIFDSDLPHEFQQKAVDLLFKYVDDDNLKGYINYLNWFSLPQAWSILRKPLQAAIYIRNVPHLTGLNPFVALTAEKDSLLFWRPGVNEHLSRRTVAQKPHWYEEWRKKYRNAGDTRQTSYVIGKQGAGKTAAALLTAYEVVVGLGEGNEPPGSVLPIYWPLSLVDNDIASQLRQFARIFARSVAVYCAMNPQSYLKSDIRRQKTIAYLFAQCIGEYAELVLFFYQNRLRSSRLPDEFLKQIESHTQGIQSQGLSHRPTDELLQLLSDALPPTFQHLDVLIDVQHNGPLSNTEAKSIQSLVETIVSISRQVHGFLPSTPGLEQHLPKGSIVHIKWTDNEVREMLRARLLVIDAESGGALNLLCDTRDVDIQNVTDRVIEASRLSPRRLMSIGQQLINRIEEHGRLLLQDDIDAILGSMDDNTL